MHVVMSPGINHTHVHTHTHKTSRKQNKNPTKYQTTIKLYITKKLIKEKTDKSYSINLKEDKERRQTDQTNRKQTISTILIIIINVNGIYAVSEKQMFQKKIQRCL